MNTETKSADALARELAMRAMLRLNGGDNGRCTPGDLYERRVILEEAKLRELCAVAEALRLALPKIWPGEEKDLAKQALAALDGGGK